MALSMSLWQVSQKTLVALQVSRLNEEKKLEQWILDDPSIIGLDTLIIGHQIRTTVVSSISWLWMVLVAFLL
jgi:hypothetical protein